jgi:AcrR family transcriptional regulator
VATKVNAVGVGAAQAGSSQAGRGRGSRVESRLAKTEADSKARRYDPTETRARVLEAAYFLFGTRGYANTGTADIAAQADVSEGSIFYHFGSKRALLVELGKLHGQKMIAAMQGYDSLEDVTFEISINRCFDFCEVNNVWEEVVQDGDCAPKGKHLKHNPEAEPFFHAAKEITVAWTRAHLDAVVARHGSAGVDTEIASELIFALVGEAMHKYFAPDTTADDRTRIRTEVIRFCNGAVGHAPTARG